MSIKRSRRKYLVGLALICLATSGALSSHLWLQPRSIAFASASSSINCTPGIGGQLFSAGQPVEVEILPGNPAATLTSDLYFIPPGGPPLFIGTSRSVGTKVNLGSLLAGTELKFQIVVQGFGWTFTIGPNSRNPDGIAHAFVQCIDASTGVVGFEDLYGGGDFSLNDLRFQVRSFDADSDGDGLPDDWERNGYTYNGQFVNLPAMGANPDHKDIFVEIDYMTGHRPDQTKVINKIVDSFGRVPNNAFSLPNPDGRDGVTLHLKVDEEITHVDDLGSNNNGVYNWSDFDALKQTHFSEALSLSYHYCIFAHNGPRDTNGRPNSGIARNVPSSDFLITLGSWSSLLGLLGEGGTATEQAGTFMHELGHNLGLRHGGFENLPNYKPNYLSVMNYSFQLSGLRFNGSNELFDYSRFNLPLLNEMNLNESIGLNGGSLINGYGTIWFCGSSQQQTDNANGAINWNCNKKFIFFDDIENSVVADIDKSGTLTSLDSFNDWANLNFKGGLIGSGAVFTLPMETPNQEIDIETSKLVLPFPPTGIAAHFTSCAVFLSWIPTGALGEFNYKIYRGLGNDQFTQILSTTSVSASDASVDGTKTYSYYMTAVNTVGSESGQSNVVTIRGGRDLVADLITLVRSFHLNNGLENSLTSILQAALNSIDRGNKQAACGQINAFVNEVKAQSGKGITTAQANQLIAMVNQTNTAMCCP